MSFLSKSASCLGFDLSRELGALGDVELDARRTPARFGVLACGVERLVDVAHSNDRHVLHLDHRRAAVRVVRHVVGAATARSGAILRVLKVK